MKKFFTSMLVFIACATLLSAQITREQANVIVQNYVQSELTQPAGTIYVNDDEPSEAGVSITTSNGEIFRAKYPCWAYYLDESEPLQRRYFFVKESNGNLLEIIASNDFGSELTGSWTIMDEPTGLAQKEIGVRLLYPNPVGDFLTLSCDGTPVRIEIYDVKGTRLYSGILSGESVCELNVSFLSAGIYMVNIGGKMYKIIKK